MQKCRQKLSIAIVQTKVVSYKLCTQKLSQLWRNFGIFYLIEKTSRKTNFWREKVWDASKKYASGHCPKDFLTPSLPKLLSKLEHFGSIMYPLRPTLILDIYRFFSTFEVFRIFYYTFKKQKCESILLFLSWSLLWPVSIVLCSVYKSSKIKDFGG